MSRNLTRTAPVQQLNVADRIDELFASAQPACEGEGAVDALMRNVGVA